MSHIITNRDITRWVHNNGVTLAAKWIIKRDYIPPVYPLQISPTNPCTKLILEQKDKLTTAISTLISI